jgi:hypothetical protein
MNYIKLIIGKDIVSIIGKYLLPSKIDIENNRKTNLINLNNSIYWIRYHLSCTKEYINIREFFDDNGGGKYWTMR